MKIMVFTKKIKVKLWNYLEYYKKNNMKHKMQYNVIKKGGN